MDFGKKKDILDALCQTPRQFSLMPLTTRIDTSHLISAKLNTNNISKYVETRAFHATPTFQQRTPALLAEVDRYNGRRVHLGSLPSNTSSDMFKQMLQASMEVWEYEKAAAVWLTVPIEQSHLIKCAADFGFKFHHAEENESVLTLWLRDSPNLIPRFATHQIGVGGVVVREDTREVLVVQDKQRKYTLWKFPGGVAELGEDISQTAEREVLEETGIQSEFQGILTFRQQHDHPGSFGRSDLFFLCHLRPTTFDLTPCTTEISACQWMTLEELQQTADTSHITQQTVKLVKLGFEQGFHEVHLSAKQYKSVYKGKYFKLFHRVLLNDVDNVGAKVDVE